MQKKKGSRLSIKIYYLIWRRVRDLPSLPRLLAAQPAVLRLLFSVGLNRALLGHPPDALASRTRPFGFESLMFLFSANKKGTLRFPFFGGELGIYPACPYCLTGNLPFCASPFGRLEPLPTRPSTGCPRFTVVPFRVRIP